MVVEYRSTHDTIRYSARKEFREPVFTGIRHIWEYINQPASNPLIHVMDMPRILDVPSFNQETVREAILNAVSLYYIYYPEHLKQVCPAAMIWDLSNASDQPVFRLV